VVSKEFRELFSVGGIFVNSELDVLGKLFVEFLEVFGIFSDVLEKFDAFLNDVLLNDFQDLVLLQVFSGNVQGKIFRINDSFDKGEAVWNEFVAIVHDEHSSDVKFDVVLLLFSFEKIEGGSFGYE